VKNVLLVFIAIFIIAVVFYQQPKVVNPMTTTTKEITSISKKSQNSSNAEKTHHHDTHPLTSHVITNDDEDLSVNPSDASHLDQISPEMREKIRAKLLFHAPIDTIKGDDGFVLMNPNGRYTQMPVAVQMPDGSITVKEYSYIPEDKK
jgi:hypothetical protein